MLKYHCLTSVIGLKKLRVREIGKGNAELPLPSSVVPQCHQTGTAVIKCVVKNFTDVFSDRTDASHVEVMDGVVCAFKIESNENL